MIFSALAIHQALVPAALSATSVAAPVSSTPVAAAFPSSPNPDRLRCAYREKVAGGCNQTGWDGLDVIDEVTGAEGILGVGRTGGLRAGSAMAQVGLNIGNRWRRSQCGVKIESPLLLCGVDLSNIVNARVPLGSRPGLHEIWNCDRRQ